MEFNMINGVLPAKYDARDYKLCASNAIAAEYPKEFELTNLPAVKNQNPVNSCAAHATSSILEYYDNCQHTLSTNFLYGIQHKEFKQDGQGMYLQQAAEIVRKYGDMLEEDCRGNNEVPKCWGIAEKSLADKDKATRAYQFRIDGYYSCLTDNDVKYALMNYGPVLGAINWRYDYFLDDEHVIHFNRKSIAGGHAVMVVGWTEKGWIIQNSWGWTWGNKGKFILPFDYGLCEAKVLIDHPNQDDIDNDVLKKPFNNALFDVLYKIFNFIVNLFR